jgi:UDP-galactopyranose mutase
MSNKKYDYLIVGAGLFGAVFSHIATKNGKKCLVIDKRNHLGGNVYCEEVNGINVHKYGAHIFHTNNKEVWDFVNKFVEFNRYTNSPISVSKGKVYNLPFNMNTFNQLWGVITPSEAKKIIKTQVQASGIVNPSNLEEQAISLVGKDIYETLIKEYTEKQWGIPAADLPAFIIRRLPVRFTYDNNYFSDKYQGIPVGGYNKLIDGLLEGVETRLNTNFLANREELESIADNVVYTGPLDELFDFKFGKLDYRSLNFKTEWMPDTDNFQGNAVVNYADKEVEYTRIIEHKHFEFGTQPGTVITKEYPASMGDNQEPYYPVNNDINMNIFNQYRKESKTLPNYIFGGRLAEYKYYDMHQVISSALHTSRKELGIDNT